MKDVGKGRLGYVNFISPFCLIRHAGCQAINSLKCSQQPDGCSQCARASQKCPGYRSQVDVIFRNESDNVVRKAKARAERVKQAKTEPSSKSSTAAYPTPAEDAEEGLEVVHRRDLPFQLSYNLVPTMEDIATSFFVSNYVIGNNGPSRGHLELLIDLKRSHSIDESLLASMKAVGLAGFSHATGAPSLMVEARQQYLKAIQLTNTALESRELVKRDSTLMGIMILGIFETLAGCNPRSVEAWAQHIHGAAAVVKLRGREQLATPTGRRMFIQVTSSLLMCCIQRQMYLPKHVVELTQEVHNLMEDNARNDPAWSFLQTMIQYAQFRADTRTKVLDDDLVILNKAMELDGIFQSTFNPPPKGWDYHTVYTDLDPDVVWNGQYHVYYDYWVAQIWNSMRSVRVLLNMQIRSILLNGFSAQPPYFTSIEHTAQFQISTDTIFKMQADILCSVPQHIDYVPTFKSPNLAYDAMREMNPPSVEQALTNFPWSDLSGGQSDEASDKPAIRASGGYFLMWPLWFAGIMDVATDEIRQFVIRNLELLADKMGVQQARVLAQAVKAKSELFHMDES